MPGPPAPENPPRRLLIRGVNWLGDVVMTTPALQRLRERLPETHITLLTAEKLAPLYQLHPAIDEVLTFKPGETLWHAARRLREANSDTTLLLPNSHRTALEAWLARIPRRIGYARAGRNWFLTDALPARLGQRMRKKSVGEIRRAISTRPAAQTEAPPPDPKAHQIYDYLTLAAALGADPMLVPPLLNVGADELASARTKVVAESRAQLGNRGPAEPVFLGLNPSAAYGPAKRWPAENYAAVARETVRRLPATVWLVFGSEADAVLCAELVKRAGGNVVNLAGKTTLRELMALLKVCRVVLTNDSGPMHVAAALGTPVVVPFGSTSPAFTAPGLPGDPRHRLLRNPTPCAPCFRRACPIDLRCLTGITVDRVTAAVLEVWLNACRA